MKTIDEMNIQYSFGVLVYDAGWCDRSNADEKTLRVMKPKESYEFAEIKEQFEDEVDALLAELDALRKEREWQPIETAPQNREVWFYVRPKTVEETHYDTSGNPILAKTKPRVELCKFVRWGSLECSDCWMEPNKPLPPHRRSE